MRCQLSCIGRPAAGLRSRSPPVVARSENVVSVGRPRNAWGCSEEARQLRLARADRTSWRDLCNTLEHHHGFCSQLPIGDGSAPGLYAMVKKQLNGLGINTWVDEERDVPPNLVTFWCFATDQGGDIAATRRLIQQDMASIPKHIPSKRTACSMSTSWHSEDPYVVLTHWPRLSVASTSGMRRP